MVTGARKTIKVIKYEVMEMQINFLPVWVSPYFPLKHITTASTILELVILWLYFGN